MNETFSNLLTEVKEQIAYLQELGVQELAADLPDITVAQETSATRLPVFQKPSAEKFQKYIPEPDFLRSASETPLDSSAKTPKESRRGLLDNARLSNLPELPKRTSSNFVKIANREETMPKKEDHNSENLNGDFSQPLAPTSETIEQIREEIGNCTRCPLHAERTNIAHSTGNFQADLMFVGEAPGADEDAAGEPFVGRAGQLLTKIIEGVQLKREDVFIGNINRCRPPGNRQPTADESAVCKPFLIREIAVVRPKVIVVLGNTATQNLLETKIGITKLRGNFQEYYGVKVMPTFHPAYLLRDPRKKREVWEDMKKVRDEINRLK